MFKVTSSRWCFPAIGVCLRQGCRWPGKRPRRHRSSNYRLWAGVSRNAGWLSLFSRRGMFEVLRTDAAQVTLAPGWVVKHLIVTLGQHRKKILIKLNGRLRHDQILIIIGHQCHPKSCQDRKPSGPLRVNDFVRAHRRNLLFKRTFNNV